MFRFDDQTGDLFILAGENVQIVIDRHGNWSFIDDEEAPSHDP